MTTCRAIRSSTRRERRLPRWPRRAAAARPRAGAARLRRLGLVAVSLTLGLVAWEAMSFLIFGPFLIPPPQAVSRAFIPMSASGELLHDIAMSLSRVFVGYAAGGIFALILGLLMGRIRLLHDLADPIVEFMRFLSPTAMIPIVVDLVRHRRGREILAGVLGHDLHRADQHDRRRPADAESGRTRRCASARRKRRSSG